MISWKKILGRDEMFFDLLEASAVEVNYCATQLKKLLETSESPSQGNIQDFVFSKRKDKEITQKINRELCRTFVTPLEREDIERLASSLYKIPKTVVKIGERLTIFPPEVFREVPLLRQVTLLEQASDVVVQMVKQLRSGGDLEKVRDMNSRLHQLEGEADKLVTDMFRDLYRGHRDARDVIILKDMFEMLEKVIDRCRDAGNTVFQIILKNS